MVPELIKILSTSPESFLVVPCNSLQSPKCLVLADRYSFFNFKSLKPRCPTTVPILQKKGGGVVHLAAVLKRGQGWIPCIFRNVVFLMKELLNQVDYILATIITGKSALAGAFCGCA